MCRRGTGKGKHKNWKRPKKMGKGGWCLLAALSLVAGAAGGGLSARYDTDGRLLVSANRGGESTDIGYVSMSDSEQQIGPCHLSEPGDSCYEVYESVMPTGHRAHVGDCLYLNITSNSTAGTVSYCTCSCGSHLYGGPEQANQSWPTEDSVYSHYPYLTQHWDGAGVAERYWLFSEGTYIYVLPYVPLFLDQNTNESEGSICLIAENEPPYPVDRADMVMEIYICDLDDARDAHEDAIENFLGKPSGVPDERTVAHPVWSTGDADEASVRELAAQVLSHGFNSSHIVIGDAWETCYGSLVFDPEKFPNATALVDELHALGFRVTLWVHPFINSDCEPYHSEALSRGYLVTSTDGSTETSWWNGQAGVVDFTNPDAEAWWVGRLSALRNETGVDSFRLDAGETSWLPQQPDIEPRRLDPVRFTADYLHAVAQAGPLLDASVAENSRDLAAFLRMRAKDSGWGLDGGLGALLATLLQMNVVGYPFVMPDVVGGGGGGVPTKELFVRWLQATVFMPTIQFSYLPWDFDDETVELSRRLTSLHAEASGRIAQLMQRAVEEGAPVNPPLWWLDPQDDIALAIGSEYLLGEELLVAPVLEEGAVSRDIYLPRGSWRDEADPQHPVYQGPAWLYNYSAPLDTLPYFSRQD